MTIARPHVVIVGAGFGGLAATRALANASVDVILIDKCNHHVFQPLLYQVATAALSPADIAAPVRSMVRDQANVRVLLDEVTGVDTAERTVHLKSKRCVTFSQLIIATGARHSYFGNDDWAQNAPGIKTIDDAVAVRRKVLLALEHAESESNADRRHALLTFVVIGAGPTGVEMAGAIAELAHRSVSRDFRSITPQCSRVVLVDAEPRVLGHFPEDLASSAQQALERLGVEVRLGKGVTHVAVDHVEIGGEMIPTETIIWAAGVRAPPASVWLGTDCDTVGRVYVMPDLSIAGHDDIFVIGDTAHCRDTSGLPLPGIAPVAKQQGQYVAQTISAELAGHMTSPFRYRHYGNLATIGRKYAVIDFGRWHVRGFLAWVLWSVAHLYFLVGFRNRFAVGVSLLWNYLTFARHARLITGGLPPVSHPVSLQPAE